MRLTGTAGWPMRSLGIRALVGRRTRTISAARTVRLLTCQPARRWIGGPLSETLTVSGLSLNLSGLKYLK
jgi:hypothetical protein